MFAYLNLLFPISVAHRKKLTWLVIVLYIVFFFPAYLFFSIQVIAFSIIPVLYMAFSYGLAGGGLSALALVVINTGLLRIAGEANFADFSGPNYWYAYGVLLLIGIMSGYLFELKNRLSQELDERKRMELEFIKKQQYYKELSLHDELTGLLNRKGFFEIAEKQLHLTKRLGGSLLLLFVDVDQMKWINDNYGSDAGDHALLVCAQVLKEGLRRSDMICISRIGGDEFVALLSSHDSEFKSGTILTRLDEKLATLNAGANRPYRVSLSFGVVECDLDNTPTIDQLLQAADRAMYDDKKNKFCTTDVLQ